jgi:predicted ester cyclase
MTSDNRTLDNKAVLRRFWEEVWTRKEVARAGELLDEHFVLHLGGASFEAGPGFGDGLAAQWFDAFPDLAVQVELQVGEGDLVAELLTFSGTHEGSPFHPGLLRARGLPPIPSSGRAVEFTQTSISRLSEGRICEMWEDFDRVRLFLQLGVRLEVGEPSG